jgi:predicted HicB family RNase H-like nuclease
MAIDGIGRPSKGHRIRLTTRVSPQTARQASVKARDDGLSISEWLDSIIQRSLKP